MSITISEWSILNIIFISIKNINQQKQRHPKQLVLHGHIPKQHWSKQAGPQAQQAGLQEHPQGGQQFG